MIFVTVGTQLTFDRLVSAVDSWAAKHLELDFFAQVGPTNSPPKNMPFADFISPARADALMRRADLIVAHAGMGSVLTALGYGKPILIMPRRAGLGEHRNDHQLATARWLEGRPGISVAWNESELGVRLAARGAILGGAPIPRHADDALVQRLRNAVLNGLKGE
jgi:UDP-N-acetylglucosamine transferase subunit ALG13